MTLMTTTSHCVERCRSRTSLKACWMFCFPFRRVVSSAVESSLCRRRISSSDSAKLTPVSAAMRRTVMPRPRA